MVNFLPIVDMQTLIVWPKNTTDPLVYVNYFYLLKNQERTYDGAYKSHYNGSNFKYLLSVTFRSQLLSLGPCVHALTSQ